VPKPSSRSVPSSPTTAEEEEEEDTKEEVEDSFEIMSHSIEIKKEDGENQSLSFNLLCLDGCKTTYEALSSTIQTLEETIGPLNALSSLSNSTLEFISDRFEEKQIDLSSFSRFPRNACNTEKCCNLLAQLQNIEYWGSVRNAADGDDGNNEGRLSVVQEKQKMCSSIELMEDALLDRTHRTHRYDIGEWVEVRDDSMRWRLAVIENVFDIRGKKVYETSTGDHDLNQSEIRWPRVGLRLIFGCGPWLWQQWACLRLEHKLRFEKGHEHDFEVMDINQYALELWEIWLEDPRNKSFRHLYERVGKSGQQQLLDHIMAPFDLIDEVVSNSDGKWNFEEEDQISMFTYCSVLGSGYFDALFVLVLQITIPIALLFYYGFSQNRENEELPLGTRLMLISVFIYYLTKITRDTITNFINVVGVLDTLTSRVRSLRSIVWENNNDSVSQSLGYSLDFFMNTGYVCLLYMFNMIILVNVSDPFEIAGSVLFFEFLLDMDEEIANTAWFDDGKRFFKAGVVGLILQSAVKQRDTVKKKAFLKKFTSTAMMSSSQKEIGEFLHNVEQQNLPDDSSFLQHRRREEEEIKLLLLSEKVLKLRDEYYTKTFQDTPSEDKSPKVFFGRFFFSTDSAIFERHEACRAWSQWEKIIFCCPTPNNVPESYQAGTKLIPRDDDLNDEEQPSSNIYYNSEQEQQLRPQLDSSDLTGGYSRWNQNTGGDLRDQSVRVNPRKKTFGRRMNAALDKFAYVRTKSQSRHGFPSQCMEVLLFFLTSLRQISMKKGFTRIFHYFTNLTACILQLMFPFIAFLALPVVYVTSWYCSLHFNLYNGNDSDKQCTFETFRGWRI